MSSKEQKANLSESKEHNEEHEEKTDQVLPGLRDCLCELCHCFVEAYVLEKLQNSINRNFSSVEVYAFQLHLFQQQEKFVGKQIVKIYSF